MRTSSVLLSVGVAVLACSSCVSSSNGPRVLASVSPPAAPPTSPAQQPSPSLSGAPPPAAEQVPLAARPATPEGAAAFARFFYAEITKSFARRDPGLIASYSLPGCFSCQKYIRSLTRLRDRKEEVRGFVIQVDSAVAPAVEGLHARVYVTWKYSGAKRYDESGKLIREEPPTSGIEELVRLERARGAWFVREITRTAVRG